MTTAQTVNADILAQLALLGTEQNRFEDFLADPSRGLKLMQSLQAFDPGAIGFEAKDIHAAASGLARLADALLGHLITKYKGHERIKNFIASGKLLLALRAGPALDRKSLNRVISTFY